MKIELHFDEKHDGLVLELLISLLKITRGSLDNGVLDNGMISKIEQPRMEPVEMVEPKKTLDKHCMKCGATIHNPHHLVKYCDKCKTPKYIPKRMRPGPKTKSENNPPSLEMSYDISKIAQKIRSGEI